MGFESQLYASFVVDALAHLVFAKAGGKSGKGRPGADRVHIVIDIGRRAGVFVESLRIVEINLAKANVDPDLSRRGLPRNTVGIVEFLHQVARLAVVGTCIVLSVYSREPEFIHMRNGPVAGAGSLPDSSCKVDGSIEARLAMCVHLGHAYLPPSCLGISREAGLRVTGSRIDDRSKTVVRVAGNRGTAVLHFIGVHYFLSGVEDGVATERCGIRTVEPVIRVAVVAAPEDFLVPVDIENVLVVLHRIGGKVEVIQAMTGSQSGVDAGFGRIRSRLPFFRVIGLGNKVRTG